MKIRGRISEKIFQKFQIFQGNIGGVSNTVTENFGESEKIRGENQSDQQERTQGGEYQRYYQLCNL